jgi:hypothetical protein
LSIDSPGGERRDHSKGIAGLGAFCGVQSLKPRFLLGVLRHDSPRRIVPDTRHEFFDDCVAIVKAESPGAKQPAEKGLVSGKMTEKHAAGAEARVDFACVIPGKSPAYRPNEFFRSL